MNSDIPRYFGANQDLTTGRSSHDNRDPAMGRRVTDESLHELARVTIAPSTAQFLPGYQ